MTWGLRLFTIQHHSNTSLSIVPDALILLTDLSAVWLALKNKSLITLPSIALMKPTTGSLLLRLFGNTAPEKIPVHTYRGKLSCSQR
jgi:hypothetical protein